MRLSDVPPYMQMRLHEEQFSLSQSQGLAAFHRQQRIRMQWLMILAAAFALLLGKVTATVPSTQPANNSVPYDTPNFTGNTPPASFWEQHQFKKHSLPHAARQTSEQGDQSMQLDPDYVDAMSDRR